MGRREIRLLYIIGCLGLVLGLSGVRSAPIYGKLDFILLDGRPWWPAWRPLIEMVLHQKQAKTVLTDPMTSTVLRAVFHQQTVHFRALGRFHLMDIEKMEIDNRIRDDLLSVKPALGLLLDRITGQARSASSPVKSSRGPEVVSRVQLPAADRHPYLCLINMHGFVPTWVAAETHHWQADLADTSLYYHYQGLRGPALKEYLETHPLKNCLVFY